MGIVAVPLVLVAVISVLTSGDVKSVSFLPLFPCDRESCSGLVWLMVVSLDVFFKSGDVSGLFV